jgi:hypothetical protein
MCKELEEELETGRKAAEAIVAHVERMGVGRLELPTMGANRSVWKVTAERIGGTCEVDSTGRPGRRRINH